MTKADEMRAELEQDLAALRRHGVQRYKGPGLEVDFFASPVADVKSDAPKVADSKCKCGHDLVTEHNAGLCIVNGCDPLKCAPPEAS